jgi:hypothetical protein
MGYDQKLFLEPPDEGLVCGVCSGVFIDPISACSDGHPFCSDCLQMAKKCSADGKPLRKTTTPAPFLVNAISKLSMRCEHHADATAKRLRSGKPARSSCDWIGACGEYAAHLTACTAVQVDCTLGCGMRLARIDAASHAQSACRLRNVACRDCKATVTAANLAAHSNACAEKVVACGLPGCDTRTKRGILTLHRTVCPRVVVPCSYAAFG